MDKYAAELDQCCEVLEQWEPAYGCNGRLCVSGHLESMLARIREQDAEIARLREGIEKAWEVESENPANDLCDVRDILFGLRAASKGEQ